MKTGRIFHLPITPDGTIRHNMSSGEILAELPKLSPSERQAIARRLFELFPGRDALEACAQAADLVFQQLDQAEADDARSASR